MSAQTGSPALSIVLLALIAVALGTVLFFTHDEDRVARPAPTPDAGTAPVETLPQIAGAGSRVHATDPVPASVLRLWLAGGPHPALCVIDRATAQCEAAPPELARAELAMGGAVISQGDVLRLDGASPLFRGGALSAYVTDGTAVVLRGDGEHRELVVTRDGVVSSRAPAPDASRAGSPELVWDQLLWAVRDEDVDCEIDEEEVELCLGDRLWAKGALDGGEPVELGPVPAGIERFEGCKTDDALVVVAGGAVIEGVRHVGVAFHDARGWSAPVAGEASGFEHTLACTGHRASLAWVAPSPDGTARHVVRVDCEPTGCTRAEAPIPLAGTDPVVAPLGDGVLLVWSEGGATHARLGPVDALADAPEIPDLPVPRAPVLSRHLFVRGTTAYLVHRTAAGLYGARIDPSGRTTILRPGRYHSIMPR